MLGVYRALLRLYPAEYRERFGEEMVFVFGKARAAMATKSLVKSSAFWLREVSGLLSAALRERVRALGGARLWLMSPKRRFTMQDGFRFPKATAILMSVILAGVVLAIRKGEAISASLPHVNPQIGPMQPTPSTLLPGAILGFAFFYAAGLIGWAILFALRRSGIHRLAELSAEPK